MDPTPEQIVERKRQLLARRGLLIVSGVIPAFAVVDGLALGAFQLQAFIVRLVWGAIVAGVALRLPVESRGAYRGAIRFVAALSAVAIAVVVHLTGGSQSLLFPVLPVLPIAVVVLTQDDGAVAWVTSAVIVVAMVVLLGEEGAPPMRIAAWAAFALGMGMVAVLGASLYRKREAVILDTERARLEAVTKLSEAERRRAESERLAVLGQLAAGVAHEINNPLAFVKSNLFFLEREGAQSPQETHEAIADSITGVERIEQIVRDLRAFSRGDSDPPELFEVGSVAQEALRIASVRLKGLATTSVEVTPGLPPVLGPRGRLLQVLVNLVVNSADAIESLPVRPEQAFVRIRATCEDGEILLLVEDNGPGLPEAVLARAFEPFFTTKPPGKGTGLGLPLSREYVERFGGSLSVTNRPEGGACFRLRLPAAAEAKAAAPASSNLDA